MFVVSEAEATAIRTAFDQGGEFAAAVELRRLFPGVTDNAEARECARAIAAWKPLPVKPRQWTRGWRTAGKQRTNGDADGHRSGQLCSREAALSRAKPTAIVI
jgi:hypothetical protein